MTKLEETVSDLRLKLSKANNLGFHDGSTLGQDKLMVYGVVFFSPFLPLKFSIAIFLTLFYFFAFSFKIFFLFFFRFSVSMNS